jgi:uncharacterized protein YecT (DUF1311 family)
MEEAFKAWRKVIEQRNEAQAAVFQLQRLIAWIERRDPRTVEDARAALNVTDPFQNESVKQ